MSGGEQNRRHSSSVPNNSGESWEQKYKKAESERKKAVRERDAAKRLQGTAEKQRDAKQASIVAIEKEKAAVEKERDAKQERITAIEGEKAAAENAIKVAYELHENEIKEKNDIIEKLETDLRVLAARTTSACEHLTNTHSICNQCNEK